MADRLPQYSMLPSNFNSNLLQQQISQSQVDPQSLPAFPNSENNRGWQNQYRSQPGANISGSQQMADLLRNHSLARIQGQQQQMGQQFGLGPQMGAQQPSFHDQATQQSIPSNFPNTAMANPSQIQQLNSRNAMMQAFQANNQGHMSRQLELMGLTQNQQSQSGYSARMVQQQQQQANMNNQSGQSQSSQPDLFSSPSMPAADGMHSSPSHSSSHTPGPMGNQQASSVQQNGQGLPAGRRHMNFQELRERAQQIQALITQQEQTAIQLSNQRAGVSDADFILKMRALTSDIKNRKELLSRVISAMSASAPNLNGPSPGNVGNMHPINGSSLSLQHQSSSTQNGQNPSSWMPQVGPSQPQGNPQMGGQGTPLGQAQSHNVQPSPLQLQVQTNNPQQHSMIPPRSGPTPHQLLAGQMSPNMTSQFPFMNAGLGSMQPRPEQNSFLQMPPPLDKVRFDNAYTSFCNSKGITHDRTLMSVENRQIDLHALHVQVMTEGGGMKVNQKELWSIIGGRLGFVQIPATENEPAKSGPGVAQHLAHVYKEYLSMFDSVYIHSVIESKRKQQAAHQAQASLNMTAGPNGSRSVPITSAQQMHMVMAYANVSAADMRAKGIPEKVIQFVDQNRANFQRSTQQQQQFRGLIMKPNQPGHSGQPSETDRMSSSSNGASQFLSQQNPSLPPNSGTRTHFIPPDHGMSSISSVNTLSSNNVVPLYTRLPHQPGPQGTTNGGPSAANRLPRPTSEQLQYAVTFIAKVKQEFISRSIQNMQLTSVQDDQRLEFGHLIEQLYRHTHELEPKLPMYCIMLKQEEMIRKLISIILTVQQQRNLLSSPTAPKYIVDLNTLRMMANQIHQAIELFTNIVQSMMQQQQQQPPSNGSLNGQPGPQLRPPIPRPPSQVPSLSQQPIPPPQPSRPVSLAQPPPPKKKGPPIQPGSSNSISSAPISTPTPPPAPSASTPVANARTPTPTHAALSPQGTKSPKSKPAPKPKPVAPKRKLSKNIPATPEVVAPLPPHGSGSKRPREDDLTPSSSGPSNEPSSPKRVKTEWEGPMSDALAKKQEEIENIKTEEEANAFLERMTELIKLAGGQGEDSLNSDIAETLDIILKGCGVVPDAPEGSGSSSMSSLGLGESLGLRQSSPPSKPPADEFVEFFDFSSFGTLDDYDAGSKAPTPDLVSSSSTNPSPESGSEVDVTGQATIDLKTEDSDLSDPLRLGQWKEIDGGESAYYQSDHWKWDSPMPTVEPPWAIFTS